ncbi:reverse transcriptase domain-containing protein [Tanacetum coccineum]
MKRCIAKLPMVTVPRPGEELILYLCTAREAVSAVLLTERDSQHMLRRYFQAHLIAVIADQPIKQILSRPENVGRMLKWRFELEAFDVTYRPRTFIRGQVLIDFIVERSDEDGPPVGIQVEEAIPDPWTLFTDGSSCIEGSGERLILTNPEGISFTYALRFEYEASSNEAEYEALINGPYVAKEQSMVQYLEKAKTLIIGFKNFSIEQVSRSENKKADALSKIASTSFAHLIKQVLVEVLKEKSIGEREVLAVVEEEGYCWMTPLLDYLTDGTLPSETKKERTVKIKSWQYAMINGVLYCKSFLEPWLQCVGPLQAEYMIREIHEGSRIMHFGPRSVVAKATRFASVKHLQTNGQVERANRSLGEGIKAKLGEDNKNWVEEVPHVLWAHRTTIKTSNGHTPFSLTYGTKAVIPVEIRMPSLRCEKIDQSMNDEALLLNLDILKEEREKAVIQEAKSKAKMERYYNAKVWGATFKPGDFVYRSNEAIHAKDNEKLGPKWEGPYEVVEAFRKGAYKIRNNSGDILPQAWNVKDLTKCYL